MADPTIDIIAIYFVWKKQIGDKMFGLTTLQVRYPSFVCLNDKPELESILNGLSSNGHKLYLSFFEVVV